MSVDPSNGSKVSGRPILSATNQKHAGAVETRDGVLYYVRDAAALRTVAEENDLLVGKRNSVDLERALLTTSRVAFLFAPSKQTVTQKVSKQGIPSYLHSEASACSFLPSSECASGRGARYTHEAAEASHGAVHSACMLHHAARPRAIILPEFLIALEFR